MPKVGAKTTSGLAAKLKNVNLPKQETKAEGPLWKGPESEDEKFGGITNSMLQKFVCCRERFRIRYIEGWESAEGFNKSIEFGQMWHICEEVYAGLTPGHWGSKLRDYCQLLCKKYPTQQEQIIHWYEVCKLTFPIYVEYWGNHKDVIERTPLLQEQVFNVPYKLPSGRIVRLRGKWDSVDLEGKGKSAGIILMENKTKGEVDEQQLKRQLSFDCQTMLYLVALTDECDKHNYGKIKGIRYNVIRRPLSSGTGKIRQHKATKNKPEETKESFYARLRDIIAETPETYFFRWRVDILPSDIARFRREFLDPILEQLCAWYEVVTATSIGTAVAANPFGVTANHIAMHWRHPYGILNPLDAGFGDEWENYLETGSTVGLQRRESLFTELQ
jgi:hypothetical protein